MKKNPVLVPCKHCALLVNCALHKKTKKNNNNIIPTGTVSHKIHYPCFHKKYTKTGVMTFVAQCTVKPLYNVPHYNVFL